MRLATLDFEKPIVELEERLEELRRFAQANPIDMASEIESLEAKIGEMRRSIYGGLTPIQRVKLARHPQRPYFLDYVDALCEDFFELHGDRSFADDNALLGGPARFRDRPVMILGHQKGRDTKDNLRRNFGSAGPEGYRKALRLMQMAERFSLPVISLVDTPGAYPGVGAEERHVAEAIAVNLREMAVLRTPVVVIVIGEGGSGGALGIGVGDRVLMLENAYYSVISPEGCAAILWKDRSHADKAAAALKLGAADLERLGIIDETIREPLGGAHRDPAETAEAVGAAIERHLDELADLPFDQLLDQRYEKYRRIGMFEESAEIEAPVDSPAIEGDADDQAGPDDSAPAEVDDTPPEVRG